MVFLHLRETLADSVSVATNFKVTTDEIVQPPRADMGDFAYGCFALAKEQKKSPAEVAKEIADELSVAQFNLVKKVLANGPYVNFYLDTEKLAKELLSEIEKSGGRYGHKPKGGKEYIFEFAGFNTHKEVHIGHVRNLALGSSLVKLLQSQGHVVAPIDFTNDLGMNVAKCIWGLQKFHGGKLESENKMEALADVYAQASAKMEDGGDVAKEEVSKVLIAMEGDKSSPEYKLWEQTRQWSLDGFADVYEQMGIQFDHHFFESDVKDAGKEKVQKLLEQGVAKKSQGAVIADFEKDGMGVLLLLKSDGTGLYSTTDLGLIDAKLAQYTDADASVVLTDSRQNQYFKQLYRVLELSGLDTELIHIGYDFVTLPEGAMSSRKGTVIRFRDLRNALVEKSAKEVSARHEDWSSEQIDEVASAIAMGALHFVMVSVGSNQKIVFDMDNALALTGMSSLYLQYTAARMHTILEKSGATDVTDFSKLSEPIEHELLAHLLWYEHSLTQGALQYDPSHVARYSFELCQKVSTFYEQCRVVDDSGEVNQARRALVDGALSVLKNAMEVLGVPVLEKI